MVKKWHRLRWNLTATETPERMLTSTHFLFEGWSWLLEEVHSGQWAVSAPGHRVTFSYHPTLGPLTGPPVGLAMAVLRKTGCGQGACSCNLFRQANPEPHRSG